MWDERICGSIWLFSYLPWWIVMIGTIILSTGGVLLLRLLTEGKIYDKARSSTPGDQFLAVYCGIVAYACQNTTLPYGLLVWPGWHIGMAAIVIALAIYLQESAILKGGDERYFTMLPAQWYHNLIVVPGLGYIIASTLPIMWYTNSMLFARIAAFACLVIWLLLVIWDISHDNMVQKKNPTSYSD